MRHLHEVDALGVLVGLVDQGRVLAEGPVRELIEGHAPPTSVLCFERLDPPLKTEVTNDVDEDRRSLASATVRTPDLEQDYHRLLRSERRSHRRPAGTGAAYGVKRLRVRVYVDASGRADVDITARACGTLDVATRTAVEPPPRGHLRSGPVYAGFKSTWNAACRGRTARSPTGVDQRRNRPAPQQVSSHR